MIQGLIHVQGSSFATGVEVQDRRKRVLVISTGSKSVDAILGGKQHVSLPLAPQKAPDTLNQAESCLNQ